MTSTKGVVDAEEMAKGKGDNKADKKGEGKGKGKKEENKNNEEGEKGPSKKDLKKAEKKNKKEAYKKGEIPPQSPKKDKENNNKNNNNETKTLNNNFIDKITHEDKVTNVKAEKSSSTVFDLANQSTWEPYFTENSFVSGGAQPSQKDRELLEHMEKSKIIPNEQEKPSFFSWWWSLVSFNPKARELWGAEEPKSPKKNNNKKVEEKKSPKKQEKKSPKKERKSPKKEEKKSPKKEEKKAEEDDDLDLFGGPTEEELKAAELQKAKNAEKKTKAKPILKSKVVFNVKGYEVDQDWEALANKIRNTIKMEGLVWQDTHKIVPIAFGMKMVQMTMIIVDELIQTDDVFEKIEAWEEEVQSVDICEFCKA